MAILMMKKYEDHDGNASTSPGIQLPKKAIQEFQNRYLKEKGIALSEQEAEQLGISLLRLYNLVYKPVLKNSKGGE